MRLAFLSQLAFFCLVIVVVGLMYESLNVVLSYDRVAIAEGEWWRLLSGNFLHLNVNHMLLNLSVYILLALLFQVQLCHRLWYMALVICMLAVSFGLWFFSQNVQNYVGLSGALYGMTVFGLLMRIRENLWVYLAFYLFVSYKVIVQQFPGYDPEAMKGFIGGNVIADAHLYGLIAGNVCVLAVYAWRLCRVKPVMKG